MGRLDVMKMISRKAAKAAKTSKEESGYTMRATTGIRRSAAVTLQLKATVPANTSVAFARPQIRCDCHRSTR